MCAEVFGGEVSCPDDFGSVDAPSSLDDLMVGLEIGGTYSGRVALEWSSDRAPADLIGASCELAGKNCFFSDDFVTRPDPIGTEAARIDFSETGVVGSTFNFAPGAPSFFHSTDYIFDEDMSVHYHSGVRFDLSNVTYTNGTSVVPLPASAPILLSGLLALAWLGRRRT